MTTLTNLNQQLFTKITPEVAEVIGGGGYLRDSFFYFWNGEHFLRDDKSGDIIVKGSTNGNITLTTNTYSDSNYSNSEFSATIINTKTNNKDRKVVRVGQGVDTTWTGLVGDSYAISLTDKSPDLVTGSAWFTFS